MFASVLTTSYKSSLRNHSMCDFKLNFVHGLIINYLSHESFVQSLLLLVPIITTH